MDIDEILRQLEDDTCILSKTGKLNFLELGKTIGTIINLQQVSTIDKSEFKLGIEIGLLTENNKLHEV